MLEQMEALGASPEDLALMRQRLDAAKTPTTPTGTFAVYADVLPVARAFQQLATQWQRAGMGGQRSGLHYEAVCAWLAMHVHRRRRKDVFAGLQVMEMAVLQFDQEQREKNGE